MYNKYDYNIIIRLDKTSDDIPYDLITQDMTPEIHKKYYNNIRYKPGIKILKKIYTL